MNRLIAFLLLLCPFFGYAQIVEQTGEYVVVKENGNYNYYEKKIISGPGGAKQTFRVLDYARSSAIDAMYKAKETRAATVVGKFGETSTGTVLTDVTKGVSKAEVFSNVLSKAKIGGRLAWGAVNVVGRVYLAYEAFNLVKDVVQGGGFTFDKDAGTFIKINDVAVILYPESSGAIPNNGESAEQFCNRVTCVKVSPQQLAALNNTYTDYKQRTLDAACQGYSTQDPAKYPLSTIGWSGMYGMCLHSGYLQTHYKIAILSMKSTAHEITQEEFNGLVQPVADTNPTPYVNVTPPDANSEVPGLATQGAVVQTGQTAQSQPYTNPVTSQVNQTNWTFNNNTVTTTIINRTDLKANSAEAPKPPAVEDTVGATPAETPSDTPASAPDLCKDHPDVLACDKLENASDVELKVPSETKTLSFNPENTFSTDAQCPAGISFNAFGSVFTYSLEPACDAARKMRVLIILGAWLVATFMVVRTVQRET